ncbi:MAG: hypothetical protein KC917_02310 [Candidatus Omnitrophica bacterium]|nr:hypothetical protein [Candidatus Omnitrophota bacterium]
MTIMSSHFYPMLLASLLTALPALGQGVTNDICSSAQNVNLSTLPVQVNGSNIGARDDETAGCATVQGGKDVYFTFTLAAARDLVIDTFGSTFDTVLSIRQGGCENPTEIDCNDDFDGIVSQLNLQQLPAGTYTILLDGFDAGDEGQYVLRFSAPALPSNNDCSEAKDIVTGTELGSTLGATDSPGMRIPGLASDGPDVFYRFTATSSQMRVDTLGSDIDTSLAVYSGCGGTLLGSNGDFEGTPQSQVSLSGLTVGNEYIIQVDSPAGIAGTFALQILESQAPPANNACNSNAGFTSLPVTLNGSTEFATDLSSPIEGGSGPEVSYRVAVSSAGNLVVETGGSLFDTVVYVRRGNCLGTQVGYNDNFLGRPTSRLVLEGLAADDYFVFVDSKRPADRGNFQVTLSTTLAPLNDTCATAANLDIPSTVTGSTEFAADDGNVNESGCGSVGPEVVYTFTLETPRRVTFDTIGSEFDTVLYLKEGACGSDTVVACNDDAIAFASVIDDFEDSPLPAGTYNLYVDGNNESGNFVLNSAFLGEVETPTITNTPTETPTGSLTETPTETPTGDLTETETPTPTMTDDGGPTETPTSTFTSNDVNGDQIVDIYDLLILVGQRRTGIIDQEMSADFNNSGKIDPLDLLYLASEWESNPNGSGE